MKDKEKIFEEAMEFISGSCMMSIEECLNAILDYYHQPEATEQEVVEFTTFLGTRECRECEFCGWWNYPGDSCDCDESMMQGEDG